jgi:hypothetical protein
MIPCAIESRGRPGLPALAIVDVQVARFCQFSVITFRRVDICIFPFKLAKPVPVAFGLRFQ